MSEPVIVAQAVDKYFGDFPALRRIRLEVNQGDVLALLGRNGAGKSTLLEIFAGLSQPSGGKVHLKLRRGDARASIGVLGRGSWLYEELTATENLRFFAQLYGVAEPETAIDRWLEQTGLERFRNSRIREFSRGMQQRLAIARAFLHEPELLLLDEPWTALDDRAMRFLTDQMAAARERGATIVVCSHQLREALEIANRAAVLDRGRLVLEAEVDDELRATPEKLYERLS